MLRYRSFLESRQLSAATINLHLCAIQQLADEAAETNLLSPELAIGIVESRESSEWQKNRHYYLEIRSKNS